MPQSPHGALWLQFSPVLWCQITLKGWSMFLSGSSSPLLHPPGAGRGQGILAHSHWQWLTSPALCLPSLLLLKPHIQAEWSLQRLKFAEVQNKNSRNRTWVRPWLSELLRSELHQPLLVNPASHLVFNKNVSNWQFIPAQVHYQLYITELRCPLEIGGKSRFSPVQAHRDESFI